MGKEEQGSVMRRRSLGSSRGKRLRDEHKERRRLGAGAPFPKKTTSYTGYSLIRTVY